MEELIEIAKITDLTNGEMKGYSIGKSRILLAKVDNNFYAVSNVCPHMSGTLSKGSLAGTIVTCPRHYSQFNLKDGNVVRWTNYSGIMRCLIKFLKHPRSLHVYPLHIEGDSIKIKIDQ
ncbi:MAG: Rieske (2Fe-2S) protein [Chloroflexi bacterium]|nr:Rieske (2Fe-2S) protein [Chloroflexota bacterium]